MMIISSNMTEPEFIHHVRNHAMQHYDKGGWDEVCEAWDDGDILEYFIEGNPTKAFKELSKTVKLRYEYAQEIRSTAF